jgi:hypothetical protein|tara:strand:- start:622 stop:1119 length:498 start_codon:yes stop_codon:yes gene_type:complete
MLDLKRITDLIIAMLKAELIMQGHKDTGALIDSFEGKIMELPKSIVLEILMDKHGEYVNDGRRKAKSEKEYVPIGVLIDWVERKGIASGDKDVKNAAFAIRQKIYKEGSPTKGSFQFSKNGRRKGFIDFVIENKLDFVYTELEKQVFEDYDASIATIVKDFNKSK